MAGDDTAAAPEGEGADAPGAPTPETIARLRTRAEQLRATRDVRGGEAEDTEDTGGEGDGDAPDATSPLDPDADPFGDVAHDPETAALLDKWTEDAPDEASTPKRNWSPLVAVAVVLVVVAIVVAGATALISGSADDDVAGGPGGTGTGEDVESVLEGDAPSLDELTSDVTLPPGPAEGLQVAAQGVTVVPDRFDANRREGTFAVVLANPHERWLAQGVQVTVTFVDEAGTALGTDNGFIEVVLPGQQVAVASLFFEAPTVPVARMDVAIDVARWRETGPFEGAFAVTEVTTAEAEFSGVRTTFTITSGFDQPLTDVGVTAVYRAADGRIIGGYDTFVERLDPGVPTPAEIDLLANVDPAEIASTELYPTAAFGSVPDGEDG
ncbi:MAG TPA: hypothetical protein VFV32_12210 [Acidimicrobiales bacterium]|nr:hypothetical protein [Acidimicrobiales bacterium]